MCDTLLHIPQVQPSIPVVLGPDATIPTRGSVDAAGLDLYAAEDVELVPTALIIDDDSTRVNIGCRSTLVNTQVRMAIPKGYVGMIKSRSSMAMKNIYTEAGIIDSDYRGDIKVCLYTNQADTVRIAKGDKIAQILIIPVCMYNCTVVDVLPETVRGSGGFGSTGV